MEKTAPKFENFWDRLQKSLKVGDEIPHWSYGGKYDEAFFSISEILESGIEIKTSNETKITVPKNDFETVFEQWEEYKNGNVLRKTLRDIPNRNTTYVISILHKIDLQKGICL